jgi:hypothetical protein
VHVPFALSWHAALESIPPVLVFSLSLLALRLPA